jgi:hypothetical protein
MKRGSHRFEANIMLGKLALRRRDPQASAKYLLAAIDQADPERIRYQQIGTELPRALVDWGKRSAVAEFLERCAKVNEARREDFTHWAADIRKGINPDMFGYMSGCSEDPC